MRILVTGAAGFIGTHLCQRLLSDGHDVLGVDNFITGCRRNASHLKTFARFSFLEHDVIKALPVEAPFDWVMHFASPASPPRYLAYPAETLRVNSEGTTRLLELARRKDARFFLASTSEVYGDPHVHPQKEEYWGNVNPIGPRSVYDEAKRYSEAATASFHRETGLPIRIIRIFNTYGPRMDADDGRVVSNLVCQALRGEPLTVFGDGSQTRSFQYVDDLVEGAVRLMSVDYSNPVNLGNPDEHTVLELAMRVKELTGSRSEIEYHPLPVDDPLRRKPDISLASALLGWTPTVSVRDGLLRTVAYFETVLDQESDSDSSVLAASATDRAG